MQLNEERINRILKKYKKDFAEMALYDETREILWAKKRIDITLTRRVIKKLKEMSKKIGKPVSHIIEESVQKSLNRE